MAEERTVAPKARWHLVGNQNMITPVENGEDNPFNVDSWDGYRPDRQELLEHLQKTETDNVVFVTGDIHSTWACDVPIDATTYPAATTGGHRASGNLDHLRQPRRDHQQPSRRRR